MEFIKYLIAIIVRKILGSFTFFKIKNKVLFYPINGKYYCNLKYITNELVKKSNVNIIWICNEHIIDKKIKIYKIHSISFFYHFLTAKIIIFNDTLPSWMLKRKTQFYIQTWHGGGAYKKINAIYKDEPNKYKKKRRMYFCTNIDYIVSACKAFTQAFKSDYGAVNAKYLEIGMPRNDIFFKNELIENTKNIIKKRYNIYENNKLILYAPTFRNDKFNNFFNINLIIEKLKGKYNKKFILMLRTHPHLKTDIFNNVNSSENIIDVTDYPDMQELLCAADILITDYSSCMWDFSLMYKPCFIYATDIDQYKQERDFYTPMSEWPFPIATNTDELIDNILNFNQEEYVQKVKQHHKDLGSFEDGHACERVCKLIEDIIDGKVKN